jgi:endonuclease/exonuclease/phosphatase (EEP) superfamily protein YafD
LTEEGKDDAPLDAPDDAKARRQERREQRRRERMLAEQPKQEPLSTPDPIPSARFEPAPEPVIAAAEEPELEPVLDDVETAPESLPPPRRRRRGRIACLLGMFIGFAGLIAGRLGVLWIHFDVFSQFTLHFAAMVVAFLLGYLMPRARVLTALALLFIAIVAIGVWPHLASSGVDAFASATGTERSLRLMSFNTRITRHNADAVAQEVLRNDPDVAILVEFGEDKRSALETLKARYPFQADCFATADCYMVIVAKFPFANVESRGVWEGPPLIKASFGSELAGVTVVGVHTIRFPHQRAQLNQVEELARYLDTIEGPRVVSGDFNATPYSRILSTFADRSRMERITVLPSWPAWLQLPQLAIDHVFASRGVRMIETARIGRNSGSDHYPIIVGLAVSPP